MENNTINAVIPQHYRSFLESIGEIDRFDRGECKCYFCHDTVSLKNVYSVFPEEGLVNYCCSNPNCVIRLSNLCKKAGG